MIDPKALEELDLASRAIERARALLAGEGNNATAAAVPRPSTAEAIEVVARALHALDADWFGTADWHVLEEQERLAYIDMGSAAIDAYGKILLGDYGKALADALAGADANQQSKTGVTQASDSLARSSMRENFTLAGYSGGHLIARTLFASRAVAFSPQPHWDQDPNPLRGECLDDAWDIVRALGARGMLSSPSPAVRDGLAADDAEVMRIWRKCGLPEYFLGNGGSNHKLVAFAKACAAVRDAPLRAILAKLGRMLIASHSLNSGMEDQRGTAIQVVQGYILELNREVSALLSPLSPPEGGKP